MSDYFELVSSRESCRNFCRRPPPHQGAAGQVYPDRTGGLGCNSCRGEPASANDPEKGSPLVAAATCDSGLNKFTFWQQLPGLCHRL